LGRRNTSTVQKQRYSHIYSCTNEQRIVIKSKSNRQHSDIITITTTNNSFRSFDWSKSSDRGRSTRSRSLRLACRISFAAEKKNGTRWSSRRAAE
jgi:hypothetical protein